MYKTKVQVIRLLVPPLDVFINIYDRIFLNMKRIIRKEIAQAELFNL